MGIIHFGVNVKTNCLKINRDNYAIIDKKVHNKLPPFMMKYYKENPESRKRLYEDELCTIYTDEWCLKHKNDCLKNYDYNMNYFKTLDSKDFNKSLNKLIKSSNKIKEIKDLSECKNTIGIYILVLDEYKQVYIGKTDSSIKKRIMAHWSNNKEFDRLIFGQVDNSILSIDSFRALDTTRIFVYPTINTFEVEEKLVNIMNPKYMLNRTAGGIGSSHNYTDNTDMAMLSILANRKKREFEKEKV